MIMSQIALSDFEIRIRNCRLAVTLSHDTLTMYLDVHSGRPADKTSLLPRSRSLTTWVDQINRNIGKLVL